MVTAWIAIVIALTALMVTGQYHGPVGSESFHLLSMKDLFSSESRQHQMKQYNVGIGARSARSPKKHNKKPPGARTPATARALCTIIYHNHVPSCGDPYADGTHLSILPDNKKEDWNYKAKIGFQFICKRFVPRRCIP